MNENELLQIIFAEVMPKMQALLPNFNCNNAEKSAL